MASSEIQQLYRKYGSRLVCPECGERMFINISKTERNPNRPFASCKNRQHKSFIWLDELPEQGISPIQRTAPEIRKAREIEQWNKDFFDKDDPALLEPSYSTAKREKPITANRGDGSSSAGDSEALPVGTPTTEAETVSKGNDGFGNSQSKMEQHDTLSGSGVPTEVLEKLGWTYTNGTNEEGEDYCIFYDKDGKKIGSMWRELDSTMTLDELCKEIPELDKLVYPTTTNPLGFLDIEDVPNVILPKKEFVPSEYQQKIFDFIKNGEGQHAVIEAVAGSGKSTTLEKGLKFTPSNADVAFVAYNVHIKDELSKRAPTNTHVSTLHSLGLENAKAALGNQLTVNKYKLYDIFDTLDPFGDNQEIKRSTCKLVGLLKGCLLEPTQANMDFLIDRYDIETNGDHDTILDLAQKTYTKSLAIKHELDFDDMIFWCAKGEIPTHKFDVVFSDESQDYNAAQRALTLKSVKPDGRVIAVGDRFQSIMGFQGSDSESIPHFIEELKAETLPLSICYRCPSDVVKLAKTLVPQIESRPDAPLGVIKTIDQLPDCQAGDMVLCRINAPLVAPCFDLIQRGIKATIRGHDIGTGLVAMLQRGKKQANGHSELSFIIPALYEYVKKEVERLIRSRQDSRALNLQDQFETIQVLASKHTNGKISDVVADIKAIFSDDKAAVTFSSSHRAKGLESDRVYILRPDLMPFPKAQQEWQKQQEKNVQYVSWTRPREELYFVKP